jgi:hypothetical protein
VDTLSVYLDTHWAAAGGGVDLAERVARNHEGGDEGPVLRLVADGIEEDRQALHQLMVLTGVRPSVLGPALARLGERLGRLKPNGRIVRRSPVSDVIEIEALRGAVAAKRAGWDALLLLAPGHPDLPTAKLDLLRARADDQLERLAEAHRRIVLARMGGSDGGRG